MEFGRGVGVEKLGGCSSSLTPPRSLELKVRCPFSKAFGERGRGWGGCALYYTRPPYEPKPHYPLPAPLTLPPSFPHYTHTLELTQHPEARTHTHLHIHRHTYMHARTHTPDEIHYAPGYTNGARSLAGTASQYM